MVTGYAALFPELSPEEIIALCGSSYISEKASKEAMEIIEGSRQDFSEKDTPTQTE